MSTTYDTHIDDLFYLFWYSYLVSNKIQNSVNACVICASTPSVYNKNTNVNVFQAISPLHKGDQWQRALVLFMDFELPGISGSSDWCLWLFLGEISRKLYETYVM